LPLRICRYANGHRGRFERKSIYARRRLSSVTL
jgi:hypothetical protein